VSPIYCMPPINCGKYCRARNGWRKKLATLSRMTDWCLARGWEISDKPDTVLVKSLCCNVSK
jgi:hypothetical protein